MATITFELDEETLEKAERVAIQRQTTLDAMLLEYLSTVAAEQDEETSAAIAGLEESWRKLSRPFGPRTWTREDLHDRSGR